MYEEGNKQIKLNWGSLAVKLVILALIVFIICLIITKLTGNKDKINSLAMGDSEYITNITLMKDAAFEYFTPSKLPEDIGETKKLTLAQMTNQKLLIDFTDDGQTCNTTTSYIQATKTADGNYALKVSLDCNEKSDFIVTTIEQDICIIEGNCDNTNNNTNTDVIIDNEDDEDKNTTDSETNNNTSNTNDSTTNNSSTNNSSSNQSSSTSTSTKVTTTVKTTVKITINCSTGICCTTNCPTTPDEDKPDKPDKPDTPDKPDEPTEEKTLYYKHIKWSEWEDGKSYLSNAENKQFSTTTYDYCKSTNKTYYSTSYVTNSTSNNSTYQYELQLLDLDKDEIENVKIYNESYFSSSLTDYRNYLNNKNNIYMTNNNEKYNTTPNSITAFRESALKSSNFTFSLSSPYLKNGIYSTKVTINYKNNNNITPYYASNLRYNVYFVPIKFVVNYIDNNDCIRDSIDNKNKYNGYVMKNKKTEYYWMHRTYEYKWSTEKVLEGYEYTGISEYR